VLHGLNQQDGFWEAHSEKRFLRCLMCDASRKVSAVRPALMAWNPVEGAGQEDARHLNHVARAHLHAIVEGQVTQAASPLKNTPLRAGVCPPSAHEEH